MDPTRDHGTASIEPLLREFPGGSGDAGPEVVGGKSGSLIELAARGFPVPPGVVLNRHFFAPWIAEVMATAEGQSLRRATPDQWPALSKALKEHAARCRLSGSQRSAVASLLDRLPGDGTGLFAVRSSSPHEDMKGASFAGGYATRLAVARTGIVDAVRECFASMFDQRVMAYRAARRLGEAAPAMAVLVQQQVHSDVSGVAFSLNPLNNDFDEAVVDANWGLGETVVSGEVQPDHWVVDKLTGRIIERVIGSKRVSRWLDADGQCIDRAAHRPDQTCLSETQLQRLVDLLQRVEAALGHPVDIEWAIAGDTLHLLQARPVTAFVPLPARLVTQPGQPRRLYMDVALSSGLTMNAPVSPLGLDVFGRIFCDVAMRVFGRLTLRPGPDDTLIAMDGGRMYLDLSNTLWLSSPQRMARSMELSDASLARILHSVDLSHYRSPTRPAWARLGMSRHLPGALWRLRGMLANSVMPFLAPERWHRRVARQLDAFERAVTGGVDHSLPIDAFWERHVAAHLQTLLNTSLSVVGPGMFAVQAFVRLAGRHSRRDTELMEQLTRGFEGNVVVEMSLVMHRLAESLEPAHRRRPECLSEHVQAGTLAGAFTQEWSRFLQRFGCRGPMEMDIAQPRYGDQPSMALAQIAAMPVDDPQFDPAASAQRQVERRRAAVATVLGRAGPLRRRVLQRLNQVIERYAGLRDTPKQHFLMILHGLRRRITAEGERLHRTGRLDEPAHVFDLTLADLATRDCDPPPDLRAIRNARRRHYDMLASQVVNFPQLIDSRGRILRPPPRPCADGFQGIGLSPGRVSGKARTMRSPHEEPLARGEILITYTTDPGWTPIFANAAAVVLEIGGALQHGAVVARELGLPCVAGIDGISTAIEDGQMIEVDGSAGTVRRLPSAA